MSRNRRNSRCYDRPTQLVQCLWSSSHGDHSFSIPSDPVHEAGPFAPASPAAPQNGQSWASMGNGRSVSLPIGSLSLLRILEMPKLEVRFRLMRSPVGACRETSHTPAPEDTVGDLTSFATVIIDALCLRVEM
jgi:hypothetical protein